jgi:hypothetical protein
VIWERNVEYRRWSIIAGYDTLPAALERLASLARWAARGENGIPRTPIEWAVVPGGARPSRSEALAHLLVARPNDNEYGAAGRERALLQRRLVVTDEPTNLIRQERAGLGPQAGAFRGECEAAAAQVRKKGTRVGAPHHRLDEKGTGPGRQ